MLYVLARSRSDFEGWLHATGLPRKVVTPIVRADHARGIRLDYRDVIRLEGFALNPDFDNICTALIPCGVQPSKIAVAGSRPL